MTATHQPETNVLRVEPTFRFVAVMLLVGVLAALGAWGLVGCSEETPTEGLAPDDVAKTLDEWFAAENAADKEALGALYSADMVVDDFLQSPPAKTEGHDQVVDMVAGWSAAGLKFAAAGEPLQLGDYVIQPVIYNHADGTQGGQGVHVFKFDGDGKMIHEWATGGFNEE